MDLARMIEFFFFFFCFQKTIHDITITRSENEELLDDTVFPLSLKVFIDFRIGQWVYQSSPRWRLRASHRIPPGNSRFRLSSYARKIPAHRPVTITITITYHQLLNLSRRPFCPRPISPPPFSTSFARERILPS